jgi:hypothetical protein
MAQARTFHTNAEAFEFACEHLDASLKDGKAVLGVVLAVQGRMCSVKIANREDKSIPVGTMNELLARPDLTHVCFSAMLDSKMSHVAPGDLVMYTTMPELAAAGKDTVAGTVVAKVNPHYSGKAGWQRHAEPPPEPAPPETPPASEAREQGAS